MQARDLTSDYGMPASVAVHGHGATRIVTLNRPASLNAVDAEMHRGLITLWDVLADDADVRSVVLTGAGKAFSTGGDFRMFKELLDDSEQVKEQTEGARQLILAMLRCRLPIVAAVNGPAVGLGSALATLCDLVLISDRAYLQDPHVPVGLVSADGGSLTWPFYISMLRAKEYILLGSKISAQEAAQIGLANRVVPHDDLMSEAFCVAGRLATLPPQAVQETKRALNMHLDAASKSVLDHAIPAEEASFSTPELRKNVAEFLTRS